MSEHFPALIAAGMIVGSVSALVDVHAGRDNVFARAVFIGLVSIMVVFVIGVPLHWWS